MEKKNENSNKKLAPLDLKQQRTGQDLCYANSKQSFKVAKQHFNTNVRLSVWESGGQSLPLPICVRPQILKLNFLIPSTEPESIWFAGFLLQKDMIHPLDEYLTVSEGQLAISKSCPSSISQVSERATSVKSGVSKSFTIRFLMILFVLRFL